MEDLKVIVGETIRKIRKEAGFSSCETLADAIGVHKNTLGDVERGDNWLSPELAQKISIKLKVPISAFYPGYSGENSSLSESQRALGELIEAIMQIPAEDRQLVARLFKSKSGLAAALKNLK